MKHIICVALLLTAVSLVACTQHANSQSVTPTSLVTGSDQEHTRWIASVMDSIHTIKPGMTRNDLLKLFTVEGGISNRLHRTYVYRQCPYIKVAVEFRAIDNPNDIFTEMPTDEIKTISNPFLQYSVLD